MRSLLTGVAALALTSCVAQAAQITYGPSVQDITFTKTVTGGLVVTVPQLDMAAFDTANAGLGGAWIFNLNFTTGPEAGGIFTADANMATFKYMAADGDALTEGISIIRVQDNTTQPKVFFAGTTTEISGDAAFLAAFGPVGAQDAGDWIMNDIGVILDALTGSASATVSAGEKTPTPTSEPTTLGLLGTALFGLGLWFYRRRGG